MKTCLKMHHLSELACLPADEIPGTFNELKPHLPEEVSKVTNCSKMNDVHGRIRHAMVMLFSRQHCFCHIVVCV
jgi:hypothetical protein